MLVREWFAGLLEGDGAGTAMVMDVCGLDSSLLVYGGNFCD